MVKFTTSEPNPPIKTEKAQTELVDVFLEKVLKNVPDEEAEKTVLLELVKRGININVDRNGEWFINEKPDKLPTEEKGGRGKEKDNSKWKTYSKRISLIGAALAMEVASLTTETKENSQNEKGSTKDKIENKIETVNMLEHKDKERFNQSSYDSLSENGKIVYKMMQENDMTPGRNYGIVDKSTGELYIIDKNNQLIHKSTAITGTGEGDIRKNPEEASGITPVGIYVVSKNFIHPDDRKEYGKLQFSLFGTALNGEKVSDIGWHQTYDSLNRAPSYNKLNPKERELSHGCVNWPSDEMEKWALPNFEGDGGEVLFILPGVDSKGEISTINLDLILPETKQLIKDMSESERKLREKIKTGEIKLSV